MATVAFIEELAFRPIIFKHVEELLGSWVSLVVVGLVFGLLHMGDENATPMVGISLVILGIMLSAAFMLTRRLWLAWGIHAGWNYSQECLFGMPGKATEYHWVTPQVDGPTWLTGGAFGIEGSVLAAVVGIAFAAYFLKKAVEQGQIVHPIWKRQA